MKKFIRILCAVLFVQFTIMPSTQAAERKTIDINANAVILLDADTGQILHEQNADMALGIASVSKLMTVYLLLDQIRAGKLKWDDEYIASNYVHQISRDMRLSNVVLHEGQPYNLRELYESILIFSANSAVISLAEKMGGTEEEFVKMIDKKAAELELDKYHFVNATGLNNSDMMGHSLPGTGPNDENVMSARDVAKIGYHIMKDYPEILETTKIPIKKFRPGTPDEVTMTNWNYMLPGFSFEYEGADGLKTGNTLFAGQCFVGTAKRGDTRLIAVVLNALDDNGRSAYEDRFDTVQKMMDFGFKEFTKETVFTTSAVNEAPLTKAAQSTVPVKIEQSMEMLMQEADKDDYHAELDFDKEKLDGAVAEGTQVGKVVFKNDVGESFDYLVDDQKYNLVTTESVAKANTPERAAQGAGNFFYRVWQSISGFVSGLFS